MRLLCGSVLLVSGAIVISTVGPWLELPFVVGLAVCVAYGWGIGWLIDRVFP